MENRPFKDSKLVKAMLVGLIAKREIVSEISK